MAFRQKIFDTDLGTFVFYTTAAVDKSPSQKITEPRSPLENYAADLHFVLSDGGASLLDGVVRQDGSRVMTGDFNVDGHRIRHLGDPIHETDAATRHWVESFVALGLAHMDDVVSDHVLDPSTINPDDLFDGALYILPLVGVTGAWSGFTGGDVITYSAATKKWSAATPAAGDTRFVNDRHATLTWVNSDPTHARWVIVGAAGAPRVTVLTDADPLTARGVSQTWKLKEIEAPHYQGVVSDAAVRVLSSAELQLTTGADPVPRRMQIEAVPAHGDQMYAKLSVNWDATETSTRRVEGYALPLYDAADDMDATVPSSIPFALTSAASPGADIAPSVGFATYGPLGWKAQPEGSVIFTHERSDWGVVNGHFQMCVVADNNANNMNQLRFGGKLADHGDWEYWRPCNMAWGLVAQASSTSNTALTTSQRQVLSLNVSMRAGRRYRIDYGANFAVGSSAGNNSLMLDLRIGSTNRHTSCAALNGAGVHNNTRMSTACGVYYYKPTAEGEAHITLFAHSPIRNDGFTSGRYICVSDVGNV